jgi:hypothetical protein
MLSIPCLQLHGSTGRTNSSRADRIALHGNDSASGNPTNKFIFISPEREYLLMDTTRQYFAKRKAEEIKECKQIDGYRRVCKQKHPIHVTDNNEDCEAEMLQLVRTVPASCSRRIVIIQTIWMQQ